MLKASEKAQVIADTESYPANFGDYYLALSASQLNVLRDDLDNWLLDTQNSAGAASILEAYPSLSVFG